MGGDDREVGDALKVHDCRDVVQQKVVPKVEITGIPRALRTLDLSVSFYILADLQDTQRAIYCWISRDVEQEIASRLLDLPSSIDLLDTHHQLESLWFF